MSRDVFFLFLAACGLCGCHASHAPVSDPQVPVCPKDAARPELSPYQQTSYEAFLKGRRASDPSAVVCRRFVETGTCDSAAVNDAVERAAKLRDAEAIACLRDLGLMEQADKYLLFQLAEDDLRRSNTNKAVFWLEMAAKRGERCGPDPYASVRLVDLALEGNVAARDACERSGLKLKKRVPLLREEAPVCSSMKYQSAGSRKSVLASYGHGGLQVGMELYNGQEDAMMPGSEGYFRIPSGEHERYAGALAFRVRFPSGSQLLVLDRAEPLPEAAAGEVFFHRQPGRALKMGTHVHMRPDRKAVLIERCVGASSDDDAPLLIALDAQGMPKVMPYDVRRDDQLRLGATAKNFVSFFGWLPDGSPEMWVTGGF